MGESKVWAGAHPKIRPKDPTPLPKIFLADREGRQLQAKTLHLLDLNLEKVLLQHSNIVLARFSSSMYKTRNLSTINYQKYLFLTLLRFEGGLC